MHFICSTFGSSGDVFPMLGLALELRSRGHGITFATNEQFEDLIRRHGLPFESLGDKAAYAACSANADLWHPQRSFRHVFKWVRPALNRQYEIHAERAGANDVVGITNCFGFGALVAQDKHHVPVITLHCQPAVLWSDLEPPSLPGLIGPRWLKSIAYRIAERFYVDSVVCSFLNPWRRELGLPPGRRITRWWNSRFGVLCMFPECYVPLDILLPRAAAFVHHGGIGSTSQGMLAGIPQILMPLAHDQFDNAERIARLGIGAWIPARRFSGARLVEQLRPLLSSPAASAACGRVAQLLAGRAGLRRSATAVEQRVAQLPVR